MAWKSSESYQEEEGKMSKINSAGLINITIENLWKESYVAMANGKIEMWNRKLDAIWMILGGDVAENSPQEKSFNALDLKIHETGSLSHNTTGFEKIKSDSKNIIAVQYILLREKSLFLRRLQNSQGKGTAYNRGDEDDWE